MTDLVIKATLTADGSGLKTVSNEAAAELKAVGAAAKSAGDQAKQGAQGHQQLGDQLKKTGDNANDASGKFKLSTQQVSELTYSARHLFEQLGSGTPITTVLTTQIGHLSAAFTSADQVGGLLTAALTSVWTYAGLAAAAIVGLAASVVDYENSVRGLTNNLNAQGNPFALTGAAAEAAAKQIYTTVNVTPDVARSMVSMASAAGLTKGAWDDLAKAAVGYVQTYGGTVPDAFNKLANAAAQPGKNIDGLNQQFNLFNGQQTENIKLMDSGQQRFAAQTIIAEQLSKQLGGAADNMSFLGKMWHDLTVAIPGGAEVLGGKLDKLVPGQAAQPALPTSSGLTNQQSNDLQQQADAVDQYGTATKNLRAEIAGAQLAMKSENLSAADLANEHRVLKGATLDLALAEHAHQQQLLSLDPIEQARVQRIKSLIAGSGEVQAQMANEAMIANVQAANVGSSALANQRLNDALQLQTILLPYVTAKATATGEAHKKLEQIIASITSIFNDTRAAQHYIETINDIRNGLNSLSADAPTRVLDEAFAQNLKDLDDWKEKSLANLDASKTGYDQFVQDVQDIYNDKLNQLYLNDLARRKDWQSGVTLGLHDLTDEQQNWAATAETLTKGAGDEFEQDFVTAIVEGKNPLQDFFTWYLEQLAKVIYQQKLASSFNSTFAGVANIIGGILGLGGGDVTGFSGGVNASDLAGAGSFSFTGQGAGIWHAGGSTSNARGSRNVPASLFAGAPRFHTGSDGLMVGEIPAILKNDEYVYTKQQNDALTARPSVIYVPSTTGGGDAMPKINFNLTNKTGTAMKASQGQTSRNSDGSINMEVMLDQVDQGLARRSQNGNSALVSSLEGTHNLRRSPR